MTATTRPPRLGQPLVAPVLAAALLVAALLLGGCGGETEATTEPAPPSATEHNAAAVAFATAMIPHHAQALTMVDLTLGRPMDPELEALTLAIRDAQAPEIQTMADWLTSWGEEIPATVRDHTHAHGDDMPDDLPDDMPGMMSAEDLAALESAGDADFADLWLEQMIAHHEGAIEMAEDEVAQGRFQPALDLAQEIIDAQTAEIATMEDMLAG